MSLRSAVPPLESFKAGRVREIILSVLKDFFIDKYYCVDEAGTWAKAISDTINRNIKELNMNQYKHVVQVIIGQQTGAGIRYISEALWDVASDQQVCEQLVNANLFCIVAVFGFYYCC